MTAQIIDRFPLILGFASMKAKDCWNGHPNRPFPRPGHCKKGLLAGWPLGIGLSEKWVPQNRWKTSFLGHDLEKKKHFGRTWFRKIPGNHLLLFLPD